MVNLRWMQSLSFDWGSGSPVKRMTLQQFDEQTKTWVNVPVVTEEEPQ